MQGQLDITSWQLASSEPTSASQPCLSPGTYTSCCKGTALLGILETEGTSRPQELIFQRYNLYIKAKSWRIFLGGRTGGEFTHQIYVLYSRAHFVLDWSPDCGPVWRGWTWGWGQPEKSPGLALSQFPRLHDHHVGGGVLHFRCTI